MVTLAAVEDGILGEEEVVQAVRILKRGGAGGTLAMRAEDLKEWLRKASRETKLVIHWWRMLIILIQNIFKDGAVPGNVAWAMVVLLPNGRGGYQGIGLVEVVWKVYVMVVNFCLKSIVTLHDTLNGFREGKGTHTSKLEANLAQKLAGIAYEPLLQVFLDVRKAYDSLDRGWCMDILQGYGMEQSMELLFTHHWENLRQRGSKGHH